MHRRRRPCAFIKGNRSLYKLRFAGFIFLSDGWRVPNSELHPPHRYDEAEKIFSNERNQPFFRLIGKGETKPLFEKGNEMDNGANSYHRFLGGDENGMIEIIRDYKDGLILYLNSFTQNIHTAEELMEETFVKIVVKKPGFSGRYSFKTWLYTIGRNTAIDYLRHNAKVIPISISELQNRTNDEESLEQDYLREEQKIFVHRAMSRLKPTYRQALFLSFFEEFSNAEIAAVMKKSKRQVENLFYRAKAALKSELDQEGFVYERL